MVDVLLPIVQGVSKVLAQFDIEYLKNYLGCNNASGIF